MPLSSPTPRQAGASAAWGGACRKLPVPLPSLASDMNSASCWTLPDLAPEPGGMGGGWEAGRYERADSTLFLGQFPRLRVQAWAGRKENRPKSVYAWKLASLLSKWVSGVCIVCLLTDDWTDWQFKVSKRQWNSPEKSARGREGITNKACLTMTDEKYSHFLLVPPSSNCFT